LQQTITMNENVQWQMIKDSVLFALSSGFSVSLFHFYLKKKKIDEVYCSVFLLLSRCINHFICYSCIVYIGDSLGHVLCLLIYFRLAAMLLNILKCISMFLHLPLMLPSGAYYLRGVVKVVKIHLVLPIILKLITSLESRSHISSSISIESQYIPL
jgi:hypothetical protein